MRIVLVLLLVFHGLLHLLGFAKAWKLAPVPELTGATLFPLPESLSKVIGTFWLLACLVLLGAAALVLVRSGVWWLVATVGVLLSQLLVIYSWPDAKAGTVANLLLAIAVLVAGSDARFQRETDGTVRALLSGVPTSSSAIVTHQELEPLPTPVRQWLEASGVVGKPRPRTVRLKQRGLLRTSPDQDYMPAVAHQYFRTDEPGFVWRVRVKMMHVLPVAGRDSYLDGRGRMLIKAASLVPVVDAAGEKIDQGTLLRFLGEIVWFPSAALSPHIRWEAIDATSARATMTYEGVTGSAVFSFDERGRFVSMSTERYMGSGADARLERWFTQATEWREMGGVVIPVQGDVIWKLASGDFSYYRWELTELEFDPPEL